MTPALLGTSGPIPVFQNPDESIVWTGMANSDEDGGIHAYHPGDTGLDTVRDAKDQNGNWCGIVLDVDGRPIIQGPGDPAPGYFISCTSYQLPQYAQNDPRRYLNAEAIPYAVVPGWLRRACRGVLMGCYGELLNLDTGDMVQVMTGDIGPRVGEYSCAAL